MTGEETFEFAAAIAGVSIGLAAILILALFAIIGIWRLFRLASESSLAATRAAVGMEELARRLAEQHERAPVPGDESQFTELRRQAQALLEQQNQLQEMARNLFDAAALNGEPGRQSFDGMESSISRLDSTVGEMAASVANLIQALERRQGEQ